MRRLLPFKIAFALAILLILIIAAPALSTGGIVTGDGTWQWVNPSPQGNTLKSVSFVDANNGYAAGIGGTVMKTTDAGATWTAQIPSTTCVSVTGAGCNLNGISFLDVNNGWVAGDFGTIWQTTDGGAVWTPRTLPGSGCGGGSCALTSIEDIHFIDANNGIAVASGYAFATSDGGVNWYVVVGINTGDYLASVQVLNATDSVAVGNSGAVYKIAHVGGTTWNGTKQVGVPSGQDLRSVVFASQTQGFAVGGTKLWRTTDGGTNWVQGTIPGTANYWGVAVAGTNSLVVTGDGGSARFRAGANFTDPIATVASGLALVTTNTTSQLLTAAYVPGSTTFAFAAGEAGAVIKTTNGGGSWSMVAGGNAKSISGASFINDSTGWAVADNGSVMKTTDAGGTWTEDSAGIAANTSLQAVDFVNATTGWAVGLSGSTGVAYKYSSGTWSQVSLPAGVASLWGISMTDATHGWMVGAPGAGATTGVALRTIDGSTWASVATGIGTDIQLNGVDSTDASTNGWAVGQKGAGAGSSGVLLTFSGGSWTVVEKPDTFFFTSVDMVSNLIGYAVGYDDGPPEAGRGYKTIDGGATWSPMTVGTSKLMAEVSFIDANTGYIAGGNGRVRKTTDGGANWGATNESLGTNVNMYTITTVPSTWSSTGYVVFAGGANAAVLRSPMPPEVTAVSPANGTIAPSPTSDVTATFSKDMAAGTITGSSFTVTEQGGPALTGVVTYDAGSKTATFNPANPFTDGKTYNASITTAVTDTAGNNLVTAYNWTFTYATVRDYLWTWYDNIGGANWVLMANPVGAAQLHFNLSIGGVPRDLSGSNNGYVNGGESITPRYPGVIGGPVKAQSLTGGQGIVSQRILWAGNSLEEVLGTDANNLSNHFWWTWYDEASPGYKDWVLVSNPNAFPVGYEIRVAGVTRASGTVPANSNVNNEFGGVIGGPVEVISSGGDVMASQRVLSSGGSAFNEVPGIPDSELSDRYLWTWYDMTGGTKDWVLIANPATNADGSTNTDNVYYRISIGGTPVQDGGPIAPGANVTPTFAGAIGGPVEVTTFLDPGHGTAKRAIVSQRVVWGPSFEEVPGYRYTALSSSYHWTWYDESAGSVKNWVLVANPGPATVNYTVKVAGVTRSAGTLAAGQRVTPDFAGVIGGPVEVTSTGGPVMSSQRVLWSGFFNETLGTVLGP